ncbi:MAG: class I SAM-dependent methyltransferase, partial [Bacteroidales bacterium]|nr:class I SAM-dependent methyltransferase [Bacteroidales bacterium]
MSVNEETLLYIEENIASDIHSLLLVKKPPAKVDVHFAVQQIEARRKARHKLPSLSSDRRFVFPSRLPLEQCSSEATAQYKALLVGNKRIADITGGLGIDTFYFSSLSENVTYIDKNADLVETAQHNFLAFNRKSVVCICDDAISFLQKSQQTFDWIYADPSRRDSHNRKMVRLCDCEPDVSRLLPHCISKAEHLLLKTSPMLDIAEGISELNSLVCDIHILAIKNDCKELLFVCQNRQATPVIHCVNILQDGVQSFEFLRTDESDAACTFASTMQTYLYE